MDDLEALLTDLQNTTAVLKRAHTSQRNTEEPIYEVQRIKMTNQVAASPSADGLEDLEQMLDDFSVQRGQRGGSRPTVDSLLTELDSAVPNGDAYRNSVPDRNGIQHDRRRPNAAEATQGLDNIMDSLSQMQVKSQRAETYPDPSYAHPVKSPRSPNNPLDAALGSIEEDMQKQGIKTIPKGDCAACHKAIVGQVVIALGKMWHPEHFSCAHCGEELGHRNFFERAQKAYCEKDYHNLFSPRCAYCNGPIKDKCINALDRTWHPEHFFCAQCGKSFGDEGFHEKDGKAYCKDDYFSMFAPRCRGCQRPIMHNYITALNTQWHPECFVCQDCKQPFAGGSFFDHEGQPYCETHYHEKRGSLCAACLKPISGRCVTAMAKKFHPEHFVCFFCQRQLNKGTFKEHENKPYCHSCFSKLLS